MHCSVTQNNVGSISCTFNDSSNQVKVRFGVLHKDTSAYGPEPNLLTSGNGTTSSTPGDAEALCGVYTPRWTQNLLQAVWNQRGWSPHCGLSRTTTPSRLVDDSPNSGPSGLTLTSGCTLPKTSRTASSLFSVQKLQNNKGIKTKSLHVKHGHRKPNSAKQRVLFLFCADGWTDDKHKETCAAPWLVPPAQNSQVLISAKSLIWWDHWHWLADVAMQLYLAGSDPMGSHL